jgi:ElaB/YqjD/DUF883 family membrane-anchored ribosome-binding protein
MGKVCSKKTDFVNKNMEMFKNLKNKFNEEVLESSNNKSQKLKKIKNNLLRTINRVKKPNPNISPTKKTVVGGQNPTRDILEVDLVMDNSWSVLGVSNLVSTTKSGRHWAKDKSK